MRVHEVATYGTILSPMLFDPRSELLVGVSVVVHIVTRWYWAFEFGELTLQANSPVRPTKSTFSSETRRHKFLCPAPQGVQHQR